MSLVHPALAHTVDGLFRAHNAWLREDGPNKGNRVPFSSKHKGTMGVSYTGGPWKLNLDSSFQSS
jgi:Fe(3+) dicitrate transport protein